MTAMSMMPIELPSWATVLNTAPASAWVSSEKASVMTMLAMVKMTREPE